MTALQIGQRRLGILATITNRDEAGRHFTQRYDSADLAALEGNGMIEITRPIHEPTGIPYSEDHYTLEVTELGQECVDTFYDTRDFEADGITPVA